MWLKVMLNSTSGMWRMTKGASIYICRYVGNHFRLSLKSQRDE